MGAFWTVEVNGDTFMANLYKKMADALKWQSPSVELDPGVCYKDPTVPDYHAYMHIGKRGVYNSNINWLHSCVICYCIRNWVCFNCDALCLVKCSFYVKWHFPVCSCNGLCNDYNMTRVLFRYVVAVLLDVRSVGALRFEAQTEGHVLLPPRQGYSQSRTVDRYHFD